LLQCGWRSASRCRYLRQRRTKCDLLGKTNQIPAVLRSEQGSVI
jgi:hypothetical protein